MLILRNCRGDKNGWSLVSIVAVKWRDLHHTFRGPAASFQLIDAITKTFLDPKIRDHEYHVYSNNLNIRSWFADHGRGKMYFEYMAKQHGLEENKVNVWFTDKRTAMMAKLVWGGR